MGTINTAEVAKKNPSVYIEMVQQKADLDLAALENSRQLSLLYLETYARENNLSESEKIHLENVIDYKVFTEEAAVKKSLWERIKAAFKRVFDWLFGKGSPKIREEDMDKKVKCAFDVDDADKKIGTMEVLIKRLTGSQTKGEADKNAQELADAVNTLKNIGNTATWTFVTLAAVDGFKSKLQNVLKSAETASDSYKQAYEKEIEKYKKEELSDEEKKERDELQEKDSKIMQAIVKCQTDLKDIESEVARLSKLSDEGKVDENSAKEGEDKGEDKKEADPDAAEMQIASGNDSGSGSAPQTSNDAFINWINNYHYRYSASQLQQGVKVIQMAKDGQYDKAYKKIESIQQSTPSVMTADKIKEVTADAGVGNKYPIGILPASIPSPKAVKSSLINALEPLCGGLVAEKVIIPTLYGSGSDWYHANKDGWFLVTNRLANIVVSNYVNAAKANNFDRKGWIAANLTPKKVKGKIEYKEVNDGGSKKKLNEKSTNWATKIIDQMVTAKQNSYNAWSTPGNGDGGQKIHDAIKQVLGIGGSSNPDPYYYTL